MECHNCPHGREIGKWRGVPFERTPCASCAGPDERPRLDVMEFDDNRVTPSLGELRADGPEDFRLPVGTVAKIVQRLWLLPDELLQVYRLKMLGLTEADVGASLGLNKSAVSKRLARIRRVDPLLVSVLPRVVRRSAAAGAAVGEAPEPVGAREPDGGGKAERKRAGGAPAERVTVWEVTDGKDGEG